MGDLLKLTPFGERGKAFVEEIIKEGEGIAEGVLVFIHSEQEDGHFYHHAGMTTESMAQLVDCILTNLEIDPVPYLTRMAIELDRKKIRKDLPENPLPSGGMGEA